MPKAEASLPSARERRVPWATPAIESTMASRSCRSFSFCLRINGSSFFSRWFRPSSTAGDSIVCRLDFGERREGFVRRAALTTRAFLARAFRAGRGFREADFFAELFFFFGLAIAL